MAKIAFDLKAKKISGKLHLEHVELLRPETIEILRNITVVCHMQPCHFLSDKKWLASKIGDLTKFAFRWRDLEVAGVPFDFGSDSPIEDVSVQKNLTAIADGQKEGIMAPEMNWVIGHTHKDTKWFHETYTDFSNGIPVSMKFRGSSMQITS
ncbi:MAG: hypothetical protein A2Z20_10170 [Bdellovibrionales bacterium RBG_16_40_8]|nr:MAG: hypothetical protein A2Z20_10170 [Bdellovibrionales bacterium RBG_16_40_8]